MKLWNNLVPKQNEPLGPRTSWGIGGCAAWFAEPGTVGELQTLLDDAVNAGMPVRVLGGGSNLLIHDGVLPGLVIHLPAQSSFSQLKLTGSGLQAGAGCSLARCVKASVDAGMAGLQNLAGIPGTIGGAVWMNAGTAGEWIGSLVERVRGVGLDGNPMDLPKGAWTPQYRSGGLPPMIITEVVFKLARADVAALQQQAADALKRKKETQPLGAKTAGCVFQNPEGHSAGRLIDEAGLKGLEEGGVRISPVHANFMENTGNATAAQVNAMIRKVCETVRQKVKIDLKTEVVFWR